MPGDEMRERARKFAAQSENDDLLDDLAEFAREELRSAAREIREFPANQDDNILVTWRQLADWLERRAK